MLALAADLRLLATLREVLVPLHDASAWPAPTWAPRTCSRAWSGSAARPSCSILGERGRRRPGHGDRPRDARRRGRGAARRRPHGAGAATGRRPRARLRDDEDPAHARARHRPRRRDRDGGARPGAPDEERRLRRVLRGLVGGKEPRVDRPLIVNPPELPEPVGFAHAVVARRRGLPRGPDRRGRHARRAVRLGRRAKLVTALRAAGAEPDDLVSLVVYTTDDRRVPRVDAASWERSGAGTSAGATRRWPLIGVSALFEPERQGRADGRRRADG